MAANESTRIASASATIVERSFMTCGGHRRIGRRHVTHVGRKRVNFRSKRMPECAVLVCSSEVIVVPGEAPAGSLQDSVSKSRRVLTTRAERDTLAWGVGSTEAHC